jgi:hypothetical protein
MIFLPQPPECWDCRCAYHTHPELHDFWGIKNLSIFLLHSRTYLSLTRLLHMLSLVTKIFYLACWDSGCNFSYHYPFKAALKEDCVYWGDHILSLTGAAMGVQPWEVQPWAIRPLPDALCALCYDEPKLLCNWLWATFLFLL